MPAKSEKQRRFMGAELGRLRSGKKTRTGMNKDQLGDFASKSIDLIKVYLGKHDPDSEKETCPVCGTQITEDNPREDSLDKALMSGSAAAVADPVSGGATSSSGGGCSSCQAGGGGQVNISGGFMETTADYRVGGGDVESYDQYDPTVSWSPMAQYGTASVSDSAQGMADYRSAIQDYGGLPSSSSSSGQTASVGTNPNRVAPVSGGAMDDWSFEDQDPSDPANTVTSLITSYLGKHDKKLKCGHKRGDPDHIEAA